MSSYRDNPVFAQLCDAVADSRLVAITGSGVSVHGAEPAGAGPAVPTWHSVLLRLSKHFARELRAVEPQLRLLLDTRARSSDYLIEAASLIRETVGLSPYRKAIVELTTSANPPHSALHTLIEELEPRGIITFNYDTGHESAYHTRAPHARGRRASALQRALYSDERKLRAVLASEFEGRFLLKAHGCITRPHSIVLDRASYRDIIDRRLGYRAFVQHVLARFNALIVGFGLEDPDFEDLLQTFEANFGGGVRDHVYIWKRGERHDEEARAVVLRRRYGLACIFVDSFDEVRHVIADAHCKIGPKLQRTVADALMRGGGAGDFRKKRRAAHRALANLSNAGAEMATAALREAVEDESKPATVRAEAAYSLGKVRPTVAGTGEFLLQQVREGLSPEISVHALSALLQLEPPVDRTISRWMKTAQALRPVCTRIDAKIAARRGGSAGKPRALKYLEALLARWEATRVSDRLAR